MGTVNYVRYNRFGAAVDLLKREPLDAFDSTLRRLSDKATSVEEKSRFAKSLSNLYPCVDSNFM